MGAVDPLSRAFSALGDPIRRDIVARLAVADASVNQLARPYDISVQAVSKHLRVLEDAGLVTRTGDATRRPAHLEAEVFDLMTKWIERYQREAEQRYRRLDDVLRDLPDDIAPMPEVAPTPGRTKSKKQSPNQSKSTTPSTNRPPRPARTNGASR